MQKQPPKVSYGKAIVKNFSGFHRKTLLFNSEYCELYKSTYFEEHLRTAASEMCSWNLEKLKITHKKL